MGTIVFWLFIMLLCFGVEIHTNAFISVFVGLGAAIAFLLAVLGMKFFPTAIIWFVLSGSLVLFLRPYALRKFKKPLNVNLTDPVAVSMTNLVGVVEATVGDELHPGRVKIHGELWNAVTTGDELPVGTRIQVEKALGTKLWITPLS